MTVLAARFGSDVHVERVAADGDLEQMVYYVVSDLSARWGYHGLLQDECCGGTPRELNVFLFYRDGQAPAANLAYNTEHVATLPDKYRSPALEDIDVGSSGINGNGRVNFMRVMYDEMDPMHRLSVIVHEYTTSCRFSSVAAVRSRRSS